MDHQRQFIEKIAATVVPHRFAKESLFSSKECKLERFKEHIPGNLMVQNPQALGIVFPNIPTYHAFIRSAKPLTAKEKEYLWKLVHREETEILLKDLTAFISRQDEKAVYSFFQRVRKNENAGFKWYFNTAKLFKRNSSPSKEIILITHPVESMGNMAAKISRLLEEHDYIKQHLNKYCLLTKREKEIISLLSRGKATSEISEMLFISENTVNTHRKNINNKLQTSSFAGLLKFALAFDMI